jgi:hypothetical protein
LAAKPEQQFLRHRSAASQVTDTQGAETGFDAIYVSDK